MSPTPPPTGPATDNGAQAGTQLPPLPAVPTTQEIYDALMSQIEAELMTEQLPLLKEKYKDETPEQAAERAARYNNAFALYEQKLAEFVAQKKEEITQYRKAAVQSLQEGVRKEEEAHLENVLSQINDSDIAPPAPPAAA